ncbi:MAG: hypothetical protein FWG82_04085 [Oscillospiraceae bacterium]|nr:hypothetical protein [Oscillospiraceae bacterium]
MDEKQVKNTKKQRKHSRKKGSSDRVIKIIEKVIAVVLVLSAVYGLGYVVVTQSGVIERSFAVTRVGDTPVKMNFYNYAYRSAYSQIFDTYAQYASYYQMMGMDTFDITKTPSDQPYTARETEIELYPEAKDWTTWADVIEFQTLLNLKRMFARYQTALETDGVIEVSEVVTIPTIPVTDENGETVTNPPDADVEIETSVRNFEIPFNSLTEEELDSINQQIESLRRQNAEQSMSLNAFLARQYGRGFTERVLREYNQIIAIAERFSEGKLAEFKAEYTDKKVRQIFNDNLVDFAVTDYRYFTIPVTAVTQKEGESDKNFKKRRDNALKKSKENAQDIFKGITNESTFLAAAEKQDKAVAEDTDDYKFDAETITSRRADSQHLNSIREDTENTDTHSPAAAWAFSNKRKAGNVNIFFDDQGNATIVYIMKPAYAVVPATVREIVITANSFIDDEETAVKNVHRRQAEAKAKELLETFNSGKKTSERFAELATTNSGGTSAESGGLTSINSSSSQDEKYLSWAFNSSRKKGDTNVITIGDDSYVLFYEETLPAEYYTTIPNEKSNEDYEKFEEELLAQERFQLNPNSFQLGWATRQNERFIRETAMRSMLYQFYQSQQNSSSGGLLDGLF